MSLQFHIIHGIDSYAGNTVVDEERHHFFTRLGLKRTELSRAHESETVCKQLADTYGEYNTLTVTNVKYAGVINLNQFRDYIDSIDYMLPVGCETMGSLTEFGLLRDIAYEYYDYYRNVNENVRIAPMVDTEWRFEKCENWLANNFE